jgi:hypothetical protein
MKLIDKLKNAIFEDEEDELEVPVKKKKEKEPKEKIKDRVKINDNNFSEDEVVKRIDVEKTIPKEIELPKVEEPKKEEVSVTKLERSISLPKREHRRTPVIFNEEDFVMEEDEIVPPVREVEKREEPKKILYGGYRDEKTKGKFKPSPVLSPVYGFVGVSPVLEQPRNDDLSSYSEMFAKEKKDVVTVDQVRKKAYGTETPKDDEDDDLGLLYDMQQEEKPAISKITLGDAEEYFDDLGLEYNVDYKDVAKERSTREVQSEPEKLVEESTKKTKEEAPKAKAIEATQELEITKEQLKPRTAKEIKKVKKIKDIDLEDNITIGEPVDEEPDEKNLYDLIDMMYESKE